MAYQHAMRQHDQIIYDIQIKSSMPLSGYAQNLDGKYWKFKKLLLFLSLGYYVEGGREGHDLRKCVSLDSLLLFCANARERLDNYF